MRIFIFMYIKFILIKICKHQVDFKVYLVLHDHLPIVQSGIYKIQTVDKYVLHQVLQLGLHHFINPPKPLVT